MSTVEIERVVPVIRQGIEPCFTRDWAIVLQANYYEHNAINH